ncbi:hypothetical protein SDC9_125700 [bioreactor metagenome]|uniref:Uncharacterized protein n=1 Tax=bioreactor metagenome TaxID=1076179 RepID=A0A645CP68_9ZZZZ
MRSVFFGITICLRELPAQNLRRMLIEPAHQQRMEALETVVALVLCQQRKRFFAERLPVPAALEFHNHRNLSVDDGEHIRKRWNSFRSVQQRKLLQFFKRESVHARVHTADALEIVVVKHDNHLVLRELNVEFHPVARTYRSAKREQRVFRHALVGGKQSAVRKHAMQKRRTLLLRAPRGQDQSEPERRQHEQHRERNPHDIHPPVVFFTLICIVIICQMRYHVYIAAGSFPRGAPSVRPQF